MKISRLIFAIGLLMVNTLSFAAEPLITFVCTGNTGRSPMAEALAQNIINKEHLGIAVESRGLEVDPKEIDPEQGTLRVLKERGIDISSHKATQLSEADIKKSTLVLTMTSVHKEKILKQYPEAQDHVFTLAEYATGKHEDLMDAYGKPLEAYKKVEEQLDVLLPLALEKISKAPNTSNI